MKVSVAKTAGFCFGVRRAVKLCEQTAGLCSGGCVTLGPIIHNRHVVENLERKGVHVIQDISEAEEGQTVILRSHGVTKDELAALTAKTDRIIDATCPDVAKIHKIVESESAQGRFIVVVGEKSHPEILAIASRCGRHTVLESPSQLASWLAENGENRNMPISAVFQTTGTEEIYDRCCEILKKECTNCKIFDTICYATCCRQNEAAELAKSADAMVVIGGKTSANSMRLAEICSRHCDRVYFIENAEELDMSLFAESEIIGITAGASTPAWIIKEVNHKMSDEIKFGETGETIEEVTAESAVESEGTESFEEMLEKSIKTLYTGEKVVGIIAAITPTEISVDLGTKQSGYIPLSELTDDPNAKVEDLVKLGDEIETFVMRVNDVEGTVMLSKKRVDAIKSWEKIAEACESREVLEGVVTEENKGGIVVSVKGVRVFVPASQSGLPKETPMTQLLKTNVKLVIKEVNQSRRRVVGSIKDVLSEARRALAEQIWAEIEEGKEYTGTVKSLTSYGAFIDIGGIDGMVHVSELSWTRIKQPSDVLSIGDTVDVYVISFDKEKRKISLGYKNKGENPWSKFTAEYSVGSVANVKIVKLMPFGAFAEVLPGVDGLIHISQITDHRIGQPSDVLNEGDQVAVKIIEIDHDKHKISLSIRALMEEPRYESEDDLPAEAQDEE